MENIAGKGGNSPTIHLSGRTQYGPEKTNPRLSNIGHWAVFLELVRTLVAQRERQSLAVIEHGDVGNEVCPDLLASRVTAPVELLGLQETEKAFSHRVIPAITLAAHVAYDAMGLEQVGKGVADVLHATIRIAAPCCSRICP